MLAGTSETQLRSAHTNLDIVLASTIRNPPADVLAHRGTNLSDAIEPFEHSDSDYKSDPAGDTAGSEHNAPDDSLRREPETEVLADNTDPVAAEQKDYPGAGNPFGVVLKSISKNAWICARTKGLRLLLHMVSNFHLGSLRSKSQRRGLTIAFGMVSETRHPSAIALSIRWRIFSDSWLCIAPICNGWRDLWRTVRERPRLHEISSSPDSLS